MPETPIDCPDCERSFQTTQGYQSHRRHKHADSDNSPPVSAGRLKSLLEKGDFVRGDGYSILLGAMVGSLLAHYPPLAGTGAQVTVGTGALYRFARRITRGDPEGAVIKYLDTFIMGVLVLYVFVYALHNGHLDFIFHLFGGHSHG